MNNNASTIKGIVLILLSALLTSIGQFVWKYSSMCQGYWKIFYTILGFAIFGFNGCFMVYAYRFGELSVLQPILSVGFVFSLILGKFYFHEEQSIQKYIGIGLILAGVFFLAKAGRKNRLASFSEKEEPVEK